MNELVKIEQRVGLQDAFSAPHHLIRRLHVSSKDVLPYVPAPEDGAALAPVRLASYYVVAMAAASFACDAVDPFESVTVWVIDWTEHGDIRARTSRGNNHAFIDRQRFFFLQPSPTQPSAACLLLPG